MDDAADVIVVGSGIQGLCAAYYLKKLSPQSSILVLEAESFIGGRATTKSAAMLTRLTGFEETTKMAVLSMHLWASLRRDLFELTRQQVRFYQTGFALIANGDGRGDVQAEYDEHRRLGFEPMLMSGAEVNEWSGGFLTYPDESIACAYEGDGFINISELLHALRLALSNLNIAVRASASVAGIDHSGGRVTAVRLVDGSKVQCRIVVNAAGIGAGPLASSVGRQLEIIPSVKNLVVVEDCGTYFTGPIVECLDDGWYLRPDPYPRRSMVVGVGWGVDIPLDLAIQNDPELAPDAVERCKKYLSDVTSIPAHMIANIRPTSGSAGYRPNSPNAKELRTRGVARHPIFGSPPAGAAPDGYFESVGWGEFGITLGAFGGDALANSVVGSGLL